MTCFYRCDACGKEQPASAGINPPLDWPAERLRRFQVVVKCAHLCSACYKLLSAAIGRAEDDAIRATFDEIRAGSVKKPVVLEGPYELRS